MTGLLALCGVACVARCDPVGLLARPTGTRDVMTSGLFAIVSIFITRLLIRRSSMLSTKETV